MRIWRLYLLLLIHLIRSKACLRLSISLRNVINIVISLNFMLDARFITPLDVAFDILQNVLEFLILFFWRSFDKFALLVNSKVLLVILVI